VLLAAIASAPAKTILFGEHFVVYGEPAIVLATDRRAYKIAYDAERLVHGTPSGIDPTIATYGGVILYQTGRGFIRLEAETDIPLVIGYTRREINGESSCRSEEVLRLESSRC
jgi:hydroxymethylglutaryl-CoA reductase